jgi:hypothetical protein
MRSSRSGRRWRRNWARIVRRAWRCGGVFRGKDSRGAPRSGARRGCGSGSYLAERASDRHAGRYRQVDGSGPRRSTTPDPGRAGAASGFMQPAGGFPCLKRRLQPREQSLDQREPQLGQEASEQDVEDRLSASGASRCGQRAISQTASWGAAARVSTTPRPIKRPACAVEPLPRRCRGCR